MADLDLLEKLRTQLFRDHHETCVAPLRGEPCDCGHTMTPAEVFEDVQLQAELDAMSDEEIEASLLESGVDKETLEASWKRTEVFVSGLIKLRRQVLDRDARIAELEAHAEGLEAAAREARAALGDAYPVMGGRFVDGVWPGGDAALKAIEGALGVLQGPEKP